MTGFALARVALTGVALADPGRRSLLRITATAVLPLAGSALLAGCGVGDKQGQVRFANLTTPATPASSATLYLRYDDGIRFADVTRGLVSGYIGIPEATYTITLTRPDETVALTVSTHDVVEDGFSSVIAYGPDTAAKLALLAENDPAPALGTAAVRILNTTDVPIDVYLSSDALAALAPPPTIADAQRGVTTGFVTTASGAYRLRVTARGNAVDLLLDVGGVALNDRTATTLVIDGGTSGSRLRAIALQARGPSTSL